MIYVIIKKGNINSYCH